MEHIRNFVIIAHVDHGKSTLADRLLEMTGTVPGRKMRPQYLDQLELERERGITIKMAPVRMTYNLKSITYNLNLIDTPGHSDFSYEVSRALMAVEGAILLVDVTKGIQAQTLSNFRAATRAGLAIVGAVNKVDIPAPQKESVQKSLAELLGVPSDEIFEVSGKSGQGVEELLRAVIEKVPPPTFHSTARVGSEEKLARALIFDSLYDDHKGILAYVRVFDGNFGTGDAVSLIQGGAELKIKELGHFMPELKSVRELGAGEIGYIATGLKEPSLVKIGDTVIMNHGSRITDHDKKKLALPGYREPQPVVFISFYPDADTKFEDLKRGFERLRLTDAALSFEPDANEALGRGLKTGFLGQLHFEIAASRLKDEFGLAFLTTFPSVAYRVREQSGDLRVIKDAHEFPTDPHEVFQPMIHVEMLSPAVYLNPLMALCRNFDLEVREVKNMGEHVLILGEMPLAELIRDFDDQMKSVSQGFASFSYELSGEAKADVEKLEVLVAGEVVSALTRIVFRKEVEREARQTVERLKNLLPKQQFSQAIQARVGGRIIARETIPAQKKDVTGYLYGGDRTRKMKLWKKQARGKERLQESARVTISPEVFREILKK